MPLPPQGGEDVLTGEYQHTVDAKGRLNFPARLREELGERFVITKGLDGCLFVYSYPEWENILQKLRELPLSTGRNLKRFLASGAAEVEADKQGRVLIPPSLRAYAKLDKDVVVAGVIDRAEIWNREAWEQGPTQISADEIALEMEQLGF